MASADLAHKPLNQADAGHRPASTEGATVSRPPGTNAGESSLNRAAQDLTADFVGPAQGQLAYPLDSICFCIGLLTNLR